MRKIAVFPGSFDPVTLGHISVVTRAVPLFDEIIIAIGVNVEKKNMFSVEQRKAWIVKTFRGYPSVKVDTYEGMTIHYCKSKGAQYILRGLRTAADFEFERGIGQVNWKLESSIETIFLLTEAKFTPITSSIVRDVFRNGGDISTMVPEAVIESL